MTLLLKDPGAVLDYAVDWGAEYLGTDEIVDSSWSVNPTEPAGVVIVDSSVEDSLTSVKAAGGAPGRIYRLENLVTLASGRTDKRSVTLRVEAR